MTRSEESRRRNADRIRAQINAATSCFYRWGQTDSYELIGRYTEERSVGLYIRPALPCQPLTIVEYCEQHYENSNVNKIFLAFSFRPENEQLVRDIERIVRSHGLVLVTGEILGGEDLTPEIQMRIKESDALIAIFTREEKVEGQEAWRPTGWVSGEYIAARARNQLAIAVVEGGVKLNGPYAANENVRLDRAAPCEAFIRVSETVGLWKILSGRSLEIRLLPEAAATLASHENARCEYRLVSPSGDYPLGSLGGHGANPEGFF